MFLEWASTVQERTRDTDRQPSQPDRMHRSICTSYHDHRVQTATKAAPP